MKQPDGNTAPESLVYLEGLSDEQLLVEARRLSARVDQVQRMLRAQIEGVLPAAEAADAAVIEAQRVRTPAT